MKFVAHPALHPVFEALGYACGYAIVGAGTADWMALGRSAAAGWEDECRGPAGRVAGG